MVAVQRPGSLLHCKAFQFFPLFQVEVYLEVSRFLDVPHRSRSHCLSCGV